MPPGPPLLHDPAAEALLCTRGWVVIPYLTREEVVTTVDRYFDLHPEGGRGFDTDFAYLDLDHKRAVERAVRPALLSHLDEHFIDGEVFNGTFVVKWPEGDSVLPVHQDWSYVDERRARSVSLWIALEDIGPEQGNGSLGLLSGSHRLPCEPRGASSLGWYRPWTDTITHALEQVAVRAGEALVFDNRIL
ncbi:MAG: phytanoyl-CoA dioxygenase family protein, partial [Aquihabitans sp.]